MGVRKEGYPFPSDDDFCLPIDGFVTSINAFDSISGKNNRNKVYLCPHAHNTAHLVLKLWLVVYGTEPSKLLNIWLTFLEEQRKEGKAECIRSAHIFWVVQDHLYLLHHLLPLEVLVGCVHSFSALYVWPFKRCCRVNVSMGKKQIQEYEKYHFVLKAGAWGSSRLWFWC